MEYLVKVKYTYIQCDNYQGGCGKVCTENLFLNISKYISLEQLVNIVNKKIDPLKRIDDNNKWIQNARVLSIKIFPKKILENEKEN
jgi:hypothetical protein